jgi:hypothetical protein
MGSGHVRSGRVVIRIGDPIPTKDLKASAREELTKHLHQEVAQMLATPRI